MAFSFHIHYRLLCRQRVVMAKPNGPRHSLAIASTVDCKLYSLMVGISKIRSINSYTYYVLRAIIL